jgi:transcription initiation factor TFIIH subunit 3
VVYKKNKNFIFLLVQMSLPSSATNEEEDERKELISCLTLVIDLNPIAWEKRKNSTTSDTKYKIQFSELLDHLFIFLKTYLMTKHHNRLCVIGSTNKISHFLYPVPEEEEEINNEDENEDKMEIEEEEIEKIEKKKKKKKKKKQKNIFDHEIDFQKVKQNMLTQLKKIEFSESNISSLTSSISLGLSFINRIDKEKPLSTELLSRILVIQATPDISSQYISMMNTIFCAQKMNVAIDSCILSPENSSFLQQAAYITGGTYMKPTRQEGFLQYLLNVYLVEKNLRKLIHMPSQNVIDFKPSCFKTKKPIDIGFVCSICLSIYSEKITSCISCHSHFQTK